MVDQELLYQGRNGYGCNDELYVITLTIGGPAGEHLSNLLYHL